MSNTRQVLDKYESFKLELSHLQLQEAKELENHELLIDNYNSLESLIEHVLSHMECVFLESKSGQRLARCLNTYAVQESCLDEEISSGLKKLNEKLDFSVRAEKTTKLLLSSVADKKLGDMLADFDKKQKNFKLALKNFKIILEILSGNDDSLAKLKHQFDEVLMDYQHSRCILDQELPFAISERTKLLADCLDTLADDYDLLEAQRNTLNRLLKGIAKKLAQQQYILVKREVFEPLSEDEP